MTKKKNVKPKGPVYWGYCTHGCDEGRNARGFVLAVDKSEALKKARQRILRERQMFAKSVGMTPRQLPKLGRSNAICRVRVWRDPSKSTAPRKAKHYVERATA